MTDLAERLRNVQTFIGVAELRIEAADEIERLQTEIAEWKRVTHASTPEDFILQVKADGEYDD